MVDGIALLVHMDANFIFDNLVLLSCRVIKFVILDFNFLKDAQHITER